MVVNCQAKARPGWAPRRAAEMDTYRPTINCFVVSESEQKDSDGPAYASVDTKDEGWGNSCRCYSVHQSRRTRIDRPAE
jgi:hypothetical protein